MATTPTEPEKYEVLEKIGMVFKSSAYRQQLIIVQDMAVLA